MRMRALIRPSMVLVGAAILAAPPLLQEAFSESTCPTGTELVTNTGKCAAGPSGTITRNKAGRLMDTAICTTYPGRETDEINWHKNKVTTLGAAPKVTKRQMVTVTGLRVAHWAMEGRSGLSFRAESIVPVQAPSV